MQSIVVKIYKYSVKHCFMSVNGYMKRGDGGSKKIVILNFLCVQLYKE